MKPQRLVPMFLLALTLPGYLLAGSGPSQKGCGCSQAQKVARKTCGCGATQKHTQKSSTGKCGCGSVQKGKGPADRKSVV